MRGAYANIAYANDYASRMAGVAYAMPTHKDCVLYSFKIRLLVFESCFMATV
jgi:hypothetical protein